MKSGSLSLLEPTGPVQACAGIALPLTPHLIQKKFEFFNKNLSVKFILEAFCVTYISTTAVAQWLRCCATNRKVAGSIPAAVSGICH
jgi:hypothetical protein